MATPRSTKELDSVSLETELLSTWQEEKLFEASVDNRKDGEPFIHAHVVLSDHNMQTLGGHLFETTVGVAGEFILTQFDGNAYRELKPDIGLACMCLETSFE